MQSGEGFLILYDIGDRISFENVPKYFEEIRATDRQVAVMIVGTKVDLEDQRQVSKEEGKEMAEELGADWFETSGSLNKILMSAKTRYNVEETVLKLARKARDIRMGKNLPKGKIGRAHV